MKDLQEITQKLDKKIDKAIVELKLESLANLIQDLNTQSNLKDFTLDIYTHEKHMRRDCFYHAQETFDSAFYANLRHGTQEISFKDHFKDLVLFAMKYRATQFYIEFSIQEKIYNANDVLNQFINNGFINENTKKSKAELFDSVVNKLANKGEDVSTYVYQDPQAVKSKPHQKSEEEVRTEAEQLHQKLLDTLGQSSPRRNSKI